MPTSPSSVKKWPGNSSIILTALFNLAQSELDQQLSSSNSTEQPSKHLTWEYLRPGVEIHRLYGDLQQGPAAALLKYQPGATVPNHEHTGYEHIVVLAGGQSDHQGKHTAGSLIINLPGSSHNIVSENGCIVLIIWEKPIAVKALNV
ncbi:MAG: cupin domain-containing protein [Phormidesmis sp.]